MEVRSLTRRAAAGGCDGTTAAAEGRVLKWDSLSGLLLRLLLLSLESIRGRRACLFFCHPRENAPEAVVSLQKPHLEHIIFFFARLTSHSYG